MQPVPIASDDANPSSGGAKASPLFVLEDVGFRAAGRDILASLSLTLEPGRIHGLLGPNGSGKSTLIKLLARQTRATSGAIRFDDAPIETLSDRAFARRLSYLPQFTPSTDGMTVAEFVALGRFPWHGTFGRLSARDREKIDEAIALTELSGFRDRLVDVLSGGERQRVWLAMMLAQDTGTLLLDEPTSALDIAHQADMLHLLRKLGRERNLSVIIVLHDINMAASICDRIVALGSGRIVADGTPAEIMQPAVLDRIYGIAMRIFRHPDTGQPIGYLA